MLEAIKTQGLLMINKRSFKIVFSVIMIYNLVSYLNYLIIYRETDVINFYSAGFISAINEYSDFWNLFEVAFPFLVVFPFAFSYIDDLNSGMVIYFLNRLSKIKYYFSKLIVCFLGGFIMIIIPFMINIILCYLTFRENNNTLWGAYNLVPYNENFTGVNFMLETDYRQFPLLAVYLFSPMLYNIVYIFLLSLFSGILSMFSGAWSFFLKKYKIMLFIPVYLLFFAGNILNSLLMTYRKIPYTNYRWLTYVFTNNYNGRNYYLFILLNIFLVLFCLLVALITGRKDIR